MAEDDQDPSAVPNEMSSAEDMSMGFDILADADAENNVQAKGAGYQVLARKYRPQNFDDMIGQEAMVQTLRNAFDSGRIAHAFMLTGVRGVGKTTTARILARALNYETDVTKEPTTQLDDYGLHCDAIMEGRHVDVMEMDAASRTGIGDIREIIDSVRYGPASARYKVYIIDEVHMLSTAAFNGLLKTLEEPPPYVKFIFATTEIRKVPVTVLSRCQRFDLRRLTVEDTLILLDRVCASEKTDLGVEAKTLIARAAEGSARDALSLLDRALAHSGEDVAALTGDTMRQLLGMADRGRVFDLLEALLKGDVASALSEFEGQYNMGAEPAVVIADLADTTHWVTRLKFVKDADQDVTVAAEQRRRGREMADALSMPVLARVWQILLKGQQEVTLATNPRAAAEMVLMRLAHMSDMPTPGDLVRAYDSAHPAPSQQSSSGTKPSGETTGASSGPVPSAKAPMNMSGQRKLASGESVIDAVSQAQVDTRPQINSFKELVAFVGEQRDIGLFHALEGGVHLVQFTPPSGDQAGRIELRLSEGQPNIAQELTKKLRQWTGEQWMITLSSSGGAETLKTRKLDAVARRQERAKADPLVQAALVAFPSAEIVSVTELEPFEDNMLLEANSDMDDET
ncbi:DNA polymerase III subunit gamma/tau [Alphaproteobacteria bacterium]|nr:DNA polymerase III subunit gamma/tau [Alphaproteobacteria bacterium]